MPSAAKKISIKKTATSPDASLSAPVTSKPARKNIVAMSSPKPIVKAKKSFIGKRSLVAIGKKPGIIALKAKEKISALSKLPVVETIIECKSCRNLPLSSIETVAILLSLVFSLSAVLLTSVVAIKDQQNLMGKISQQQESITR